MRTVGVKLVAEASSYVANLRRAGVATRQLAGELDKANKAGKLDAATDQAMRFGVVGAAAFAGIVKSAADFDKQMSAVAAATHANTAQVNLLRQAAIQAGKDTAYSATEAAKGITELSKAGVGTADILGGGLKGALSLAAAGQLDVSEAAETAASAMTQFSLKGNAVPHVADLLAAAAGKAQGSVHDLGYALSQSGLVASQAGLSIEDTTGTLAAFASAGLLGQDAGTSFKTMLLALQNPSAKTRDLMKDLGISAYDTAGNFVGIVKFAQILRDKLGNLTPELRQQALAQMFGNDAVRAGTILYQQGAQGIQDWINKTNDAGYAAETAAKLTDNLAGDIERLKGSLETMAIESGSGANSGLRLLTKSLGSLVDEFGRLPSGVSAAAVALTGVGGVLLVGAAGWLKMRRATSDALAELAKTGPAGERAAAGLGKVQGAVGKVAAAFAALEVAGAVIHHFQDDLNPQIDALAVGLNDFAHGGKLAGEASRILGSDLGDLETGFKFLADDDNKRRQAVKNLQEGLEALPVGLDGTNKSLAKTKERITALDQAMSQMVGAGQADQARLIFDKLGQSLAVNGVSMEEFRKQFPQYAAALESANNPTKTITGSIAGVGKEAGKAEDEVKKLQDAFDSLFDRYMSADEAGIKYRETLRSTNKELESGRKTLKTNSEEGDKNRQAILDQVDAISKLRTATISQTGNVQVADKTYRTQLETLRKHLLALGYDKNAVNELIQKYKAIPPRIDTKVGTPGLPQADKSVKDYDKKLDDLARQINTNVKVVGVSGAEAQLKSLLIQQQALRKGISVSAATSAFNKNAYAAGGWTGPGSTYEPAGVVHADEFVIKKASRQKIEQAHPGLLDQMNDSGELGYAGGGRVLNAPFRVNAAMTKIPSLSEALSAVTPSGGATDQWMERVARIAFPGIGILSAYRRGAHTLNGNLSYHALHRAVDFAPSRPFAEWVNAKYFNRTKELITPWQDLNIRNGARHRYSEMIENEHSGSNAHDHWAMRHGGTIREPVFGFGMNSGDTYSFGEGGIPETVVPGLRTGGSARGNTYQITISPTPLAHPRDIGREVVNAIQAYERGSGASWREG